MDSLYEIIPDLNAQIKDESRFPSKYELEKLSTWKIFEPFFQAANRWPNPMTTTVGIPYGKEKTKGELHKNSLYRIRTENMYYTDKNGKENNLPKDCMEIELWVDIYETVMIQIKNWLEKNNIDNEIYEGTHIDEKTKNNVVVLKIYKPLEKHIIEEFNDILRKGYERVSEIMNSR